MNRWDPVVDVRFVSDWLKDESGAREEARKRGWILKEWTDDPGVYHPPHDHPYDHRVVVISGSMEFKVSGETYRLEPGDGLDLPSGVTHEATSDGDRGSRYWQLQPPE